jgi:hypothetical protein
VGPPPYDTRLPLDNPRHRLPPLPDRWRRHIHPEGVVLFYHEGLVRFFFMCITPLLWTLSKRIFTESDISDPKKEQDVLCCAVKLIQQAIGTHSVTLDELTEIVLNVDDSRYWYYYFVDHTHRLLFWVESVSVKELNIGLQGIAEYSHISMFDAPLLSSSTNSHLGYMVEAHYWYASPVSLSGMSVLVAFYSVTNPNSSISHMTWNGGRIVNTTPTIVPFQNEPSKNLGGCSIMQRPVHPFCEIPTAFLSNHQT